MRRIGGDPAVPDGAWTKAPSQYALGRPARSGWLLRSLAAGAVAAAAGGLLYAAARRRGGAGPGNKEAAARHLYQGGAILSFSVLADSALEHYRGGFENRAMFIAPTVAFSTLLLCLRGPRTGQVGSGLVAGAAIGTGAVGTMFHVYNLGKRRGGFSWLNLFYGAPLGAPAAMALAGLYAGAAARIAPGATGAGNDRLVGLPPGKALAGLTAAALLGTTAEVWLLHFRGAFQNPFMLVPVVLPPAASAGLALAGLRPTGAAAPAARLLLAGTAAAGLAGVGFHSYGIARNMGGWANWMQNLQGGPPLPAPPSFTGIAVAGLGALRLMEADGG